MKDAVNLKWINNLAFEAVVDGHKMIVDAKPEVGGTDKGPRPKPLMMVALAGGVNVLVNVVVAVIPVLVG